MSTPALLYSENVTGWHHWRRSNPCDVCGEPSDLTGRDPFDIRVRRTLCNTHARALAEANEAAAEVTGGGHHGLRG